MKYERPPKAAFPFARCLVFIACLILARGNAQEASTLDKERQLWRHFPEVSDCGACHAGGNAANPLRPEASLFPRMNELAIWLQSDKHAVARVAIEPIGNPQKTTAPFQASQVLSHQICTELGWDVQSPKGYRLFESQCLVCHAGTAPAKREADATPHLTREIKQPGISCAYCHQVESRDDWVALHPLRRTWSDKPHAEKEAAGLKNLTSIPSRQANCLDCHLGNLSTGQFVTHAMYVAGHPPLRSFELGAFSQAMPKHWMSSSETIAAARNLASPVDFLQAQYPELNVNKANVSKLIDIPWETRQTLLASLVAAQRSVELLRDASKGEHAGDYALYDCYACHHPLRLPSPRQELGYAGIPGRPRLPAWTRTLSHAAEATAGTVPKTRSGTKLWTSIDALLDRTPFGEPKEVASAAETELARLSEIITNLEKQWFDGANIQRTTEFLSSTPNALLADYASAQQVVWAFEAIARDWEFARSGIDKPGKMPAEQNRPDVLTLRNGLGVATGMIIPNPAEERLYRANYLPANFLPALRAIPTHHEQQ
jgi:hypothetical protein